jgi:hypothetical protein
MGSGRETIEPRDKAHKRADSGVVVGNGARMCSLREGSSQRNKQGLVLALKLGLDGFAVGV